ncbi:hypothetical protein [Kribbella monticola]|uniref:hypothetical protein n=1 Tax=Kribbella monticola TaxID=2185285 RepID=UPI000DD3A5D9|nr:hypothetical protein [Kribbella monticola]
MNLTTPPPVEDLDPQYADELRSALVDHARRSRRQRPVWVPALAAACGIAVITTAVVVMTRPQDDDRGPASTSQSVPPPPSVQQVPAAESKQLSLDLEPATRADALPIARQCLAAADNNDPQAPKPAEADTAVVHSARWVHKLSRPGRPTTTVDGAVVVQSFTTAKGIWVSCVGAAPNVYYAHRDPGHDVAVPVKGQWTFTDLPDGNTTHLYTGFTFLTIPAITRLEIRIRWSGGASDWYGVQVVDGFGYVEASQLHAVHQRDAMEIDVRAFDRHGKQLYSGIEYG